MFLVCNISVFILDRNLINLAPTTTISENSRLNLIIPLYFKSLSTLTLSASITLWGLRSFHSSSLSSPSNRVSSQLLLSCLLLCSVHANFPHSHGRPFHLSLHIQHNGILHFCIFKKKLCKNWSSERAP